jgi:hypothetical protein
VYHFTESGGMRKPLPVWKPTPTVGFTHSASQGVALTIQSVGKCVQDLIFGGTFLIEFRLIRVMRAARGSVSDHVENRVVCARMSGSAGGAPAAGDGGPVWASGPLRSRVPPMTAPAAKIPAIHQNAVS